MTNKVRCEECGALLYQLDSYMKQIIEEKIEYLEDEVYGLEKVVENSFKWGADIKTGVFDDVFAYLKTRKRLISQIDILEQTLAEYED